MFLPVALAQPGPLPSVDGVRAEAGNHFVTLQWEAVDDDRVKGFRIHVYRDGSLLQLANTTGTSYRVAGLINDRSYAFQVQAFDESGNTGPLSPPVAATPTNPQDLVYLAVGLIVTWLSLFGYAALLARRELQLSRKLDRLLDARTREEPR